MGSPNLDAGGSSQSGASGQLVAGGTTAVERLASRPEVKTQDQGRSRSRKTPRREGQDPNKVKTETARRGTGPGTAPNLRVPLFGLGFPST